MAWPLVADVLVVISPTTTNWYSSAGASLSQ